MNTQKIKQIESTQASSKSFLTVLGNFLHRGKLTNKQNTPEVIMQLPTNPRMRTLDTVLDRSRFIWERTASNNN